MSGMVAVLTRELKAYFFSPIAYVVLTLFLLLQGFVLWLLVGLLSDPRMPAGMPLDYYFGRTVFTWFVLVFAGAFLTMRLFAEELRSGTIETLMTAPVTEAQVVLGKFLAAFLFYACLWASTLAHVLLLRAFSPIDWGPIASSYVGMLSIGAFFLSIGTFASALSRNQIVAAIFTFVVLTILLSAGFLGDLVQGETARRVIDYLSLPDHMDDFAKGIVDTRRLVYYLSGSALFLFLTARAVAVRKWR